MWHRDLVKCIASPGPIRSFSSPGLGYIWANYKKNFLLLTNSWKVLQIRSRISYVWPFCCRSVPFKTAYLVPIEYKPTTIVFFFFAINKTSTLLVLVR